MMDKKWRWGLLGLVVVAVLLTIFLVIFLTSSTSPEEIIIVDAPVGSISGIRAMDGDYNMFLGIPYAQVNLSNPFGASTPYSKFDTVFVADDNSKICAQPNYDYGVLDCLHLSISVPDTARNSLLPVMVWIHGGAFVSGTSNTYGAKFLVKQDVIVVTINYRLGPYGFMCLDIPEVPGNQGLKDQVLALRWIKDNIEAFGGDVNKVTLFGLSAGAHSIDFHILSDTEILYNNAILQSGSSLASTVFTNHPKRAPIDIAAQLGFVTDSMLEAISYLSTVDPNQVIYISNALNFLYKPCTEMYFENVEPFLTRPWVTADTPKVEGIPILVGFNDQEMLLRYANNFNFDNYNAINDRLSETFNFDDVKMAEMEANIRNFYFGDKDITVDLLWEAIEFDSDYTYVYPIHRTINKYLASKSQSIFLYVFAYYGERNLQKITNNVTIGTAAHGDEWPYLFDSKDLNEGPTVEDQLIIDRMTTMWTNFAKYSDPTPETSSLLPIRWPSITVDSYNYMTIDSEMTVGRRPNHGRMTFWDLFYKFNAEHEKGYYEN
ncbi:cholinesterase-like [Ostrinia furnacalis]|uniref:cholinesterase-like n=1 Tax=Ostrinia furnacalis TaxID=93504 RepID=UPI00103B9824|nr:cholinesterase-like [Ostrinia furnacalis]